MALIEYDLFGSKYDKIQKAIDRIRAFEPEEGYFVGFSGGKDSVVIKALCEMAGVKYDAHYNVTTVDPPELVRYIRSRHSDVIFDRPKLTMRQLIIKKMFPPTRLMRYCCEHLKETHGEGRVTMTGVRWAESGRRKQNQGVITLFNAKEGARIAEENGADFVPNNARGIVLNLDNDAARRTVEHCYRTNKTLVNPIIDWTDEDVWEFIRAYGIPYCSLYDEGWKRLGCVGCPLNSSSQKKEFIRWPVYKKLYINAFDDMLEARRAAGKTDHYAAWTDGEGVFAWWTGGDKKHDPNQITIQEIERMMAHEA